MVEVEHDLVSTRVVDEKRETTYSNSIFGGTENYR